MIKLFKWIFYPNWLCAWADCIEWDIEYQHPDGRKTEETCTATYSIWYSEQRKTFKLKLEGYKPKLTTKYSEALKELSHYQKQQNP